MQKNSRRQFILMSDYFTLQNQVSRMSNNQQGETVVENPAWKNAREALKSVGGSVTENQELLSNQQNPYPSMPSNPPLMRPPMQYDYNHGYNYYPGPTPYGGMSYNQR